MAAWRTPAVSRNVRPARYRAAVTYRPRRGPRPVRHVSEDGRLVHSLSVQGIYRLAESSAADLETVLAGPPGEPIPLHLDPHATSEPAAQRPTRNVDQGQIGAEVRSSWQCCITPY
jgi:hypothetical protein